MIELFALNMAQKILITVLALLMILSIFPLAHGGLVEWVENDDWQLGLLLCLFGLVLAIGGFVLLGVW